MSARSIQDELFPDADCFGCGPVNRAGLRLKSYWSGDRVDGTFSPLPEHGNGFGSLNGGVIATLLDCHSGAAVYSEIARAGGASPIFVTTELDIRYLRPAPLNTAVALRARLDTVTEDEIVVMTAMSFDEKVCATARAVWRRQRPR